MTLTPEQAAQFTTPDVHIDSIQSLVKKIADHPLIAYCVVDDYGRFSNFQIVVRFTNDTFADTNKGILTRKLNAMFDKLLKGTGAHRRETFSPTAQTKWNPYSEKNEITGYDRTYWMIDIDFHNFDASSNYFDEKTVEFNLAGAN